MDSVYDRALSEVGSSGRFQKSFDILYNVIMVIFFAMACMNVILILVVVPHSCELPEKPENLSDYEWKFKHLPMNNDAKGELSFSKCFKYKDPGISNDTTECTSFEYNTTWYKNIPVLEYNWVCDKEIYVANIFAYTRIGEIVGAIVLGWFGDTYGRRLTYTISIALTIIGRIMTLVAGQSFYLFVSGCVIAAIPSWMAVQSATVIAMEISSPERRSTINTLRSIGWTVGMCIMPMVYWALGDWKWFFIATTVGLVPYMLMSWRFIESPRWLWMEGRQAECVKVLKRIARSNNKRLDPVTEHDILTQTPPKDSKGLGPLALFSSWILAFNTSLQLTLWVTMQVSYTVLIMGVSESPTGNPFLEFAWQSAAEMPGNFIGAWLADSMGRRYAGGVSSAFSAGLWILFAVRSNSTWGWLQSWMCGAILNCCLRISITVTYYVISLLNMELYPTCLRQSGMSLGSVVASAAMALGPYILFIGRNIDARLPGIILMAMSLLGSLAFLLLPETLNSRLPETLDDAKHFGKGRRNYFSMRFQKPSKGEKIESGLYIVHEDKISNIAVDHKE